MKIFQFLSKKEWLCVIIFTYTVCTAFHNKGFQLSPSSQFANEIQNEYYEEIIKAGSVKKDDAEKIVKSSEVVSRWDGYARHQAAPHN